MADRLPLRLHRRIVRPTACLIALALLLTPAAALAQGATVSLGDGSLTGKAIQLIMLMTVLSLAPGILMTVTSFTRIVVPG